jgi:ribosomal protein L40E
MYITYMEVTKMAIFDSLSTKLSAASQKAVQKANDVADQTKMSIRTSEINKNIQELYAKLGEEYFNACNGEPMEALSGTYGEIKTAKAELEEISTKIQRIKQVKVCPTCGTENSGDTAFCGQCGTQLPELQPREQTASFCPQCGAKLSRNAQFCPQCGAKIQQDTENGENTEE